jgi:RecA-family ATPase
MENPEKNNKVLNKRPVSQEFPGASGAKPRRKIIGTFVRENTVTYFYAPPDYGKTMAVFQAAYCAATGTAFAPCSALMNECEPKVVIVADLENEDFLISDRHSAVLSATDPALLDNMIFLHEPVGIAPLFNYDLLQKILDVAIEKKAEVIIVDNISKLASDLLHPEQTTRFIECLERIRLLTGAALVLVGHTIKHNTSLAVQPTSYYGTSMLIDYFKEMFYLDRTRYGNYFLAQVKTKHRESYKSEVPVFSFGDHPVLGTGFEYLSLKSLADIQLPLSLVQPSQGRKNNLARYQNELRIMELAGIRRSVIAEICDVSRGTISKILDKAASTG